MEVCTINRLVKRKKRERKRRGGRKEGREEGGRNNLRSKSGNSVKYISVHSLRNKIKKHMLTQKGVYDFVTDPSDNLLLKTYTDM